LAGWLAGLVPLGHGALAAGEGGVWLSTGGSAGWSALGDGRAATALAASSDGSVIYAAIGPGVIASRDGGQTWGPSGGNGLPANLTLQRLAVDAANPNHLLIAGQGLWASSDGGSGWSQVSNAAVTDLAWSGSSVLAAAGSALLISRDDGASFAAVPGMPGTGWAAVCAVGAGFEALATGVAPSITPFDAAGNAGMPLAVPAAATAGAASFALACSGNAIWLGGTGLWRTADQGANWSSVSSPISSIGAIRQIALSADGSAWLATDTGAWRASAGGGLQSANQGLMNAGVTGMALGAATATLAMERLGIGAGAVQAGSSWTQVAASPVLQAMADDPWQAGSLDGLDRGGALLHSNDAGKTWTAAAASGPFTALAASLNGTWLGNDRGVVTAPNGGDAQLPGAIGALAADRNGASAWAGSGAEVWRSADGGQTWARASVLPSTVTALALDPVRNNRVAAATADGVYASLDGGTSWIAIPAGLTLAPVAALAFDSGETLWAGTLGRGLWNLALASEALNLQFRLPASAAVGATVTVPITLAALGQPVQGAVVNWSASESGITAASGSVASDANGAASVTFNVPQQAGTVTVAISVAGAGPSAASAQSFAATALAVSALAVVSGANQQALAGLTLPQPITVEAEDPDGNPVAGVTVGFTGGSFSAASVVTGNDGLARVNFTLPPQPGAVTLTASAGAGMLAHWNETATAPPDFRLGLVAPATPVAPNQNASLSLQVIGINGFASAVAVQCVVPASGCSVSPASLLPGGSAIVTINGAVAGNQGAMTVEVEADATHTASATVLLEALGLAASANALSVQAGSTGTLPLTVTSQNGLAGSVTLSATMADGSPLPANLVAAFQPAALTVAPSGGPMPVQLALAASSVARTGPGTWLAWLAAAALLVAEIRRRRLVLLLGAVLLASGCGGAPGAAVPVKISAPAVSYGLAITASSSGLTATVPVTVTVQP